MGVSGFANGASLLQHTPGFRLDLLATVLPTSERVVRQDADSKRVVHQQSRIAGQRVEWSGPLLRLVTLKLVFEAITSQYDYRVPLKGT